MIQSNNLFFHCGGELVVTTALALKQLGDIQNAGLTAVSFLFLIALWSVSTLLEMHLSVVVLLSILGSLDSKWQVDCLIQLCASSVCFGLHSSTLCTFSVSRDSFTHFTLSSFVKTQCVPTCFDVSFRLSACHHNMCRKLCSENKNERRMLQSEETFTHMSDRFLSPALPPLAS